MATPYHVLHDGQPTGPFERVVLVKMAADGALRGETMVWTDGMADWTAARAVPDLAGLFHGAPPPPPRPGPTEPPPHSPISKYLPVAGTVRAAYSLLRKHPRKCLTAAFLSQTIPMLGDPMFWFGDVLRSPNNLSYDAGDFVVSLPSYALSGVLGGGLCFYLLCLHRNEPVQFDTVFAGFRRFWDLAGYGVLVTLLILVPAVTHWLLFVPAVFAGVCATLTTFYMLDTDTKFSDSVKRSYHAVMRLGWWPNFGLFLIVFSATAIFTIFLAFVFGLIAQTLGMNGGDAVVALLFPVQIEQYDARTAILGYIIGAVASAPGTAFIAAVYTIAYERAQARDSDQNNLAV